MSSSRIAGVDGLGGRQSERHARRRQRHLAHEFPPSQSIAGMSFSPELFPCRSTGSSDRTNVAPQPFCPEKTAVPIGCRVKNPLVRQRRLKMSMNRISSNWFYPTDTAWYEL